MTLKKKLTSSLLALSILATPFAGQSASAAGYKDPFTYYEPVDIEGHWAENDLWDMLYADIVKGTIETVKDRGIEFDLLFLNPDDKITRGEFVSFIVRALELKNTGKTVPFKDISKHWGRTHIQIAYQNGVVSGTSATTFEPNKKITRAEMASMIVRSFNKTVEFKNGTPRDYKDLPKNHWAYNHLRMVNGLGIMKGISADKLAPNNQATRAESIVMILRSMKKETANLPTKAMLETVILDNETKGTKYINEQNYNALKDLTNVRQMGFAHSSSNAFIEYILEPVEVTYNGIIKGKLGIDYENAKINTRLVEIELENAIYDMTRTDDEGTRKYEKDGSGTVFLRLENSRWKMYTSDEIERNYQEWFGYK
ncbi:S-layer homology domain-containing protein [Fictibacillus phosphorivorans]|uniref:S-layer homology domain-containing protein n=1 Tax=Fictibacillus phosphorivorans TaxID=1221500 RepID=UPI00203C35CD|nr:S-layer homology domain-containing protein [Fictibacillus phosphorivorans]MCM3718490.1 S-layer homology domain-containing protein [Fictibacillus phosphorivorans]MCM3776154.1 S-layer homology domain-containing protein [Fictibacillus phosphorivorans]